MSIVELINELKGMEEFRFADRSKLVSADVAYTRRVDFDNWLRKFAEPGRRFVGMDDAWAEYEKSFG